jgi:hypothetical protein
MIYTTIFTMQWPGNPAPVSDGQMVYATIPAGCVLRMSSDLIEWTAAPSVPFVHSGEPASYRIDCDNYFAPVTAVLTVSEAG